MATSHTLRVGGRMITVDVAAKTLTTRRGILGKTVRPITDAVSAAVEPSGGRYVLRLEGRSWAELLELPAGRATDAHAFAQAVNLAARS